MQSGFVGESVPRITVVVPGWWVAQEGIQVSSVVPMQEDSFAGKSVVGIT